MHYDPDLKYVPANKCLIYGIHVEHLLSASDRLCMLQNCRFHVLMELHISHVVYLTDFASNRTAIFGFVETNIPISRTSFKIYILKFLLTKFINLQLLLWCVCSKTER